MGSIDQTGPVVLTRVPSEMVGMLLVGRLEREGIEARLAGGGLAGFRAETPVWVQVLVRRGDEGRARELMGEWEREKSEGEEGDDELTAEDAESTEGDEGD